MPKQKKIKKHRKKLDKLKGVATPPVPDEERQKLALLYLHTWHEERDKWSFKKKLQYWLLSNLYEKEKISKSDFKLLLQYLDKLKGFHRLRMISEAQGFKEKYEKQQDTCETLSIHKTQYKRAIKILKTLT